MTPAEHPAHVTYARGNGGLTKVTLASQNSAAQIYLHGAHVTGFQKNGDLPLLFMSGQSLFASDKPIRGGVPICFPWFGGRDGDVAHGFARVAEWELERTITAIDGSVSLHLRLPEVSARPEWKGLQAQFIVTVSDQLIMELRVTNTTSLGIAFEGCLHTYFAVGDISQVSITGLKGVHYIDKVDKFANKVESDDAIRISSEVDRVYINTTGTVEIHDDKWRRKIRVEKSGSASTVVWNPWITKAKAMPDFGAKEYKNMVCVESGNVGENKITLAPGKTSSLKVSIGSHPLT